MTHIKEIKHYQITIEPYEESALAKTLTEFPDGAITLNLIQTLNLKYQDIPKLC